MVRGDAKVFIGLGGNLVAASSDTPLISEAFRKLNLTVNVATKLNRTHIVHGRKALILPCLARSEVDRGPDGAVREVSIEDSVDGAGIARNARFRRALTCDPSHGSLRTWREPRWATNQWFPGNG
jgi:hypothetical protein